MLLIVDIDGTILCHRNRLEKAGPPPKKKNAKTMAPWLDALFVPEDMVKDPAIEQIKFAIKSMCQNYAHMVYLTSRGDYLRKDTKDWIKNNNFPDRPVIFRKAGDYRSSAEHKREEILKLMEKHRSESIIAIDDDTDGTASDMYKELGIIHLKVER